MGEATFSIEDAANTLERGLPLIFPTDTVVGIGISVSHPESLKALYQAKGRDEGKPVAWLVSSAADIDKYCKDVPSYAKDLAARFWPGGLTLVMKASGEVPEDLRSNTGTIGLRMPDSEVALALIRKLGCPVATTSANMSGTAPSGDVFGLDPTFAPEVARLAIMANDSCVKGCDAARALPSTIIDCTGIKPCLIREGEIPFPHIEDYLKGATCE